MICLEVPSYWLWRFPTLWKWTCSFFIVVKSKLNWSQITILIIVLTCQSLYAVSWSVVKFACLWQKVSNLHIVELFRGVSWNWSHGSAITSTSWSALQLQSLSSRYSLHCSLSDAVVLLSNILASHWLKLSHMTGKINDTLNSFFLSRLFSTSVSCKNDLCLDEDTRHHISPLFAVRQS